MAKKGETYESPVVAVAITIEPVETSQMTVDDEVAMVMTPA
jgi:hypothetical protein